MFDDHIRKQGGDEYVIRSAVRVHGGDGRSGMRVMLRCCNMNRLQGDDGGWGIAALPVGPASCRSSRWGGGDGE